MSVFYYKIQNTRSMSQTTRQKTCQFNKSPKGKVNFGPPDEFAPTDNR